MEWEEQVNGMANSLEKSLKKFTHKITGLHHELSEEEMPGKWHFKTNGTEKKEFFEQKEAFFEQKTEQKADGKAIVFEGQNELNKKKFLEILPMRIGKFDQLIGDQGIERGSTILLSGGAGTGKTTFSMQSIYNGALNGEKGIYLSFEEEPEKIIAHMKKNFAMDFEPLQKKGLVAII